MAAVSRATTATVISLTVGGPESYRNGITVSAIAPGVVDGTSTLAAPAIGVEVEVVLAEECAGAQAEARMTRRASSRHVSD